MQQRLVIMSGLDLPRVCAFRSLADVAPLKGSLDELNMASRRPSPFGTFAYMEAFAEHDESATPGQSVLFLVAYDGESPVGFVPLREVPEHLYGVPYTSVRFLVSHDNDRPRVVSRPDDELRCSEAFYRYLFDVERGWSVVELIEQDAESGLAQCQPSSSLLHYYVRRYPTNPNATLDLSGYRAVDDYLDAMEGKPRKNLRHAVRKLIDDCSVDIVSSSDPRALPVLFELYLDLERRSWKAGAEGHIGRHPERIEFFRRILGPSGPLRMSVYLMLHDGLPIAGMIAGSFAGHGHAFEEAFDEGYRRLAPGNTMLLWTIRDAIEQRQGSLNLFGNYAYYKEHWLATITETEAVQIYRVGSAVCAKALVGEAMRTVRPPFTQREATYNLARRSAGDGEVKTPEFELPARALERSRARAALSSLESGPASSSVARISAGALREALLGASSLAGGKNKVRAREVTP